MILINYIWDNVTQGNICGTEWVYGDYTIYSKSIKLLLNTIIQSQCILYVYYNLFSRLTPTAFDLAIIGKLYCSDQIESWNHLPHGVLLTHWGRVR